MVWTHYMLHSWILYLVLVLAMERLVVTLTSSISTLSSLPSSSAARQRQLRNNNSVVNILHSHSYSLPAAAAAFLLFVIVDHLTIDYLHPRMELEIHLYH